MIFEGKKPIRAEANFFAAALMKVSIKKIDYL
jgi:hypothetical protein